MMGLCGVDLLILLSQLRKLSFFFPSPHWSRWLVYFCPQLRHRASTHLASHTPQATDDQVRDHLFLTARPTHGQTQRKSTVLPYFLFYPHFPLRNWKTKIIKFRQRPTGESNKYEGKDEKDKMTRTRSDPSFLFNSSKPAIGRDLSSSFSLGKISNNKQDVEWSYLWAWRGSARTFGVFFSDTWPHVPDYQLKMMALGFFPLTCALLQL